MRPMQLFHYHLLTSKAREVEARYVGKLGFELIARHGRIGDDLASVPPGISWQELDELGFELGRSELALGAVNVVVQPGRWELPRVDHLGLALDDDELEEALGRAQSAGLPVREDGERPAFVSTNAGYRLELRPRGGTLDTLLAQGERLRLLELHLKTDDPDTKAAALAAVLGGVRTGGDVEVGETLVRFVPGGPQGRPELYAERFT
jgi:catechol 2,3-dioxygenase-like lactoylglutathione lyase family enzyme